ncbi:MAG: hypothetical protein II885_12535, partial [Oscillospiraceae bacterium]|nr:hypothetical protein [Oscillospiraceae bacterium]
HDRGGDYPVLCCRRIRIRLEALTRMIPAPVFFLYCQGFGGGWALLYQKERIALPASDLKWKGQIIVRPKM